MFPQINPTTASFAGQILKESTASYHLISFESMEVFIHFRLRFSLINHHFFGLPSVLELPRAVVPCIAVPGGGLPARKGLHRGGREGTHSQMHTTPKTTVDDRDIWGVAYMGVPAK